MLLKYTHTHIQRKEWTKKNFKHKIYIIVDGAVVTWVRVGDNNFNNNNSISCITIQTKIVAIPIETQSARQIHRHTFLMHVNSWTINVSADAWKFHTYFHMLLSRLRFTHVFFFFFWMMMVCSGVAHVCMRVLLRLCNDLCWDWFNFSMNWLCIYIHTRKRKEIESEVHTESERNKKANHFLLAANNISLSQFLFFCTSCTILLYRFFSLPPHKSSSSSALSLSSSSLLLLLSFIILSLAFHSFRFRLDAAYYQ